MKNIQYGLSLLVLVSTAIWSGCGGDKGPSVAEVTTKKLTAHAWNMSSVTVDNIDQSALFDDMTITFSATGYTTVNGGPVWPASGSWQFADDDAKVITRSDGLEIGIVEVTDTNLKLTLTWDAGTFGNGRVNSVAGNHEFNFVK
jgi:hypothetical protein